MGTLRTAAPASAGYHRANGIGGPAAAAGTVIERQPTSNAMTGLQAAKPNTATAAVAMKLRMVMFGFSEGVRSECALCAQSRLNLRDTLRLCISTSIQNLEEGCKRMAQAIVELQ